MSFLRATGPFAAVSFIAVIMGAITAHLHGVGPALIALNLAAWVIGLSAAFALSKASPQTALPLAILATAALATTLASPGMEGVHRWIGLGPLKLNAAEAVLPLALVALASLTTNSRARLLLPAAIAVLLAKQPDASQACAFTGGALALVLTTAQPVILRALTIVAMIAAATLACLLPDPLAPVPYVEGIIGLAAQSSPILAALTVLALAAIPLLIANAARSSNTPAPYRLGALSLAIYFALASIASALGAFPVPLIGIGLSPILGFWLGIGFLTALKKN
ncbi:hypothetical protein FHS83_003428 [Rhizomicrobium palustre]|uniref:Uncharacterized protein n=1 Tax=Rhizomicrobium palustre TaxID=189966 RepID=A0A846N508_9PROT|nr:hypothetical protein [Rhizomicrobium palustre]NIK90110.1 hypothetical protein [Rhizomicrobium palustre]